MSSMTPLPAGLLHEPASNAAHSAFALDAIHQIQGAADAAQVLERLVAAVHSIGATAGLFIALIPEPGDEPSVFSLFACDPRLAHEQLGLGPWHDHPWVRFARASAAAGTERDAHLLTPGDVEAVDLARRHGFESCLIVPAPSGAQLARFGMLCLGSAQEGHFQRDSARFAQLFAYALAAELHAWVATHVRTHLQQSARLGQADIELLSLQWQGLGTKAISQRTGLSIAAVDSRFQRLARRLGCPSRKAAAQRAAEYGLLSERLQRGLNR
jgi:DNA-binding CsgD family transcriptional regulator